MGVLGGDDGAPSQVTASGARAGERVGTTVAVYVTEKGDKVIVGAAATKGATTGIDKVNG